MCTIFLPRDAYVSVMYAMARYSSGRQYVTTHMPVYIKTAERIEFVFGRSFAAKTASNLCVDNRLRPRCPICCRCIRRKSGASGYRQFVAEIICTLRSRISLTTACVTWLCRVKCCTGCRHHTRTKRETSSSGRLFKRQRTVLAATAFSATVEHRTRQKQVRCTVYVHFAISAPE